MVSRGPQQEVPTAQPSSQLSWPIRASVGRLFHNRFQKKGPLQTIDSGLPTLMMISCKLEAETVWLSHTRDCTDSVLDSLSGSMGNREKLVSRTIVPMVGCAVRLNHGGADGLVADISLACQR